MDKSRLRFIFELVGVSAIALSLVFVALQIKQDQQLTRSELGAGTMNQAMAFRMASLESDFHKTFVKMVAQPNMLTIEEIAKIDTILKSTKAMMIRECYLVVRGVFAECESTIRAYANDYFRNGFAQSWWKQNSGFNPFLPDWVDEEVAGLDPAGNLHELHLLQDQIE